VDKVLPSTDPPKEYHEQRVMSPYHFKAITEVDREAVQSKIQCLA